MRKYKCIISFTVLKWVLGGKRKDTRILILLIVYGIERCCNVILNYTSCFCFFFLFYFFFSVLFYNLLLLALWKLVFLLLLLLVVFFFVFFFKLELKQCACVKILFQCIPGNSCCLKPNNITLNLNFLTVVSILL